MDELGNSPELMPEILDVSEKFLELDASEFSSYLHTVRKVPTLKIEVDISNMQNGPEFVDKMRKLKAFLEYKPRQQERTAKVMGQREQRKWEANVFSSGVEFEVKE